MTAEEFFDELNKLIAKRPRIPSQILHSENTEWGNNVYYSKNLYWAFETIKSVDSAYVYDSSLMVKCFDCDYSSESELSYECNDALKCYNCEYIDNCANMRDASFCCRSSNCHDVFGCTNLKNKSFCIFNRQLTEADYRNLLPKYKALPKDKIFEILEGLKKLYPYTQTNELDNVNSSYGNYFYRNKNSYLLFDAIGNEDSGYMFDAYHSKSCFDVTQSTGNQLSCEVTDSASLFNCHHIVWCAYCQDSAYLFDCSNVSHCLGCVGINRKDEYCILNRKFSKEEYERISKQILDDISSKNLGWANLVY